MGQYKPTNYLQKYGNITGYGSKYWKPGLDIDLKIGDDVSSAKGGEVIFSGVNGGFGNQVKVRDSRGNELWYSHLDNNTSKVGDKVEVGQSLGTGGNSGKTYSPAGGDGSHLDLTIKRGDQFLTAEQVEKYVSYEPLSSLVDRKDLSSNIDKLRSAGKTDTEILDYFGRKDKDTAKKIKADRARYSSGGKVTNDRELLNFLGMRASGAEPTVESVASRQEILRKSEEEQKNLPSQDYYDYLNPVMKKVVDVGRWIDKALLYPSELVNKRLENVDKKAIEETSVEDKKDTLLSYYDNRKKRGVVSDYEPNNREDVVNLSNEQVEKLYARIYSEQREESKDATIELIESALLTGGKLPGEIAGNIGKFKKAGGELVDDITDKGKNVIDKGKSIIKKTDKPHLPKTEAAEAAAPKVTFTETIAGVRPDIKKRISGKTEKFDEYMDVVKARNFDDTADSPLAYASKKVAEARDILRKKLADTGSDIGKFREKLKTTKAGVDKIQDTIGVFDSYVLKKGVVPNKVGKITTAPGRETVFSVRELKELQDIRDSLVRLKGDPTLERIMDNRFNIDRKINFAKRVGDISGEVDPVSRAVRKELKEINEAIIGKTEAANMEKYGDLIGIMDDLDKLTSKGQNAEFLMKRVLSERDRLPKKVLKAVEDETGIDLLDEAQFSQIVTEIAGNPQTKGLFRQEIEKAGLDVISMVNPKIAAVSTLLQKGAEKVVDPVKTFRKATKTPLNKATKATNLKKSVSSAIVKADVGETAMSKVIAKNPEKVIPLLEAYGKFKLVNKKLLESTINTIKSGGELVGKELGLFKNFLKESSKNVAKLLKNLKSDERGIAKLPFVGDDAFEAQKLGAFKALQKIDKKLDNLFHNGKLIDKDDMKIKDDLIDEFDSGSVTERDVSDAIELAKRYGVDVGDIMKIEKPKLKPKK